MYTRSFFTCLVVTAFCLSAQAQLKLEGFDSAIISKPSSAKLRYNVVHPMFNEISIRVNDPQPDKRAGGSVGGFFGRTIAAGVLGNWTSSRETNVRVPTQIITEPSGYGWNVDIYIDGEMERSTNRVRNSDGSRSTETVKTLLINWNHGGWGNIIDKTDTIGAFALSVNPRRDSVLMEAYKKLKDSLPDVEVKRSFFMNYTVNDRDFGIFGDFKGSSFYMLYFQEERLGYIFMNKRLDAVVITDNEQPGVVNMMGKKKRLQPKLWLRHELTENQSADMIRMALLCRLLAQSTSKEAYEY